MDEQQPDQLVMKQRKMESHLNRMMSMGRDAQIGKLQVRFAQHSDDWLFMEVHDLLQWLENEVQELRESCESNDCGAAWLEAGDVANLAFMVADRLSCLAVKEHFKWDDEEYKHRATTTEYPNFGVDADMIENVNFTGDEKKDS